MKMLLLALCLASAFAAWGQTNSATSASTLELVKPGIPKSSLKGVDFSPELAAITEQIKAKFAAGLTNWGDLKTNHQVIHALILQHFKDGNREQLARLYLLDAHIFADGTGDIARARAIWNQVVRDFPGTVAARGAAISLDRLDAQLAAEPDPSIPEGLQVGQKFPGFTAADLAGDPLSVAGHRGHVTLVDFWATWCGPCRGEMPNVIATYNQYHSQGFDIIGISLDSDRDALASYTQAQGMTWPQYFDGLAWHNKLAVFYGVNSIPMDYLLDTHGIILGKELRGAALPAAVAKALAGH